MTNELFKCSPYVALHTHIGWIKTQSGNSYILAFSGIIRLPAVNLRKLANPYTQDTRSFLPGTQAPPAGRKCQIRPSV